MYKKLSNDEWREYINRYYDSDKNLTVKDYCKENNINKTQFYYHKRRINERATPVFHPIKINAEADTTKEDLVFHLKLRFQLVILAYLFQHRKLLW